MKRLLLVALMVHVTMVGMVGVNRVGNATANTTNGAVGTLQTIVNEGRPANARMDWRIYSSSDFGLYQYDAANIGYLSYNIVRVSQKLVLNDRGATNLVRELGKEYDNVKEIVIIREIDYTGKNIRMVGLIYFSDNGRVIKREAYEPKEWDSIIPDSVDDVLYQAVSECLVSAKILN
jgi:hypothetical protein